MVVPVRTKIYSIFAPSRGLALNVPAPFLTPQATPDAQNVRFYDSIVEKRTGYPSTVYANGTITGTPIKLYTYTKENGTDYEILATTSNIIQRTTGDWADVKTSLTNTVTSRVTMCTMHKAGSFYLCYGSKQTAPRKWDGTDDTAILETTTYKPKIMLPYQFRLLMFNLYQGATDYPITFRYSAPDNFEDWDTAGSTGSRNMVQGMGSQIMNAVAIKDYVGVYKDKSISVLSYVGGSSIFATAVHIDGIGLLAQDAIVNLGTSHIFLASDYNIYEWNGGWELIPIGNAIRKYIKDNLYVTNKLRCFAVANYERTEAHFFIPINEDDYPTVFLTYNWTDKTWALNTVASCSGGGNLNTSGVEKTMIGLYSDPNGTVHNYDYSSLNDGSTAINSYFTTPDITVDKEEYKIKRKDYRNVYVDAKGDDLSMSYSTNEGSTYPTTVTISSTPALSTTIYNLHDFNFTEAARNIRFKFANSASNESYSVRFVGIEHKDVGRK